MEKIYKIELTQEQKGIIQASINDYHRETIRLYENNEITLKEKKEYINKAQAIFNRMY